MTAKRGEVWLANLNPTRGSEQAGIRPVIIYQNNSINRFTHTFLAIPVTTNLRRALLPTGMLLPKGEGGLINDSVALCHQLRVIDKSRLSRKLGSLSEAALNELSGYVLFTIGIF